MEPITIGDIVLVKCDPHYGDWAEAIVVDIVTSVVVKLTSGGDAAVMAKNPELETEIFPMKDVIHLRKTELSA